MVTLTGSEDSMHVEVLAVDSDSDENLSELGECPVPVKQAVSGQTRSLSVAHG